MKLTTIDVPPYEESYPYNVLYDILKVYEYETEDANGLPIIINPVKEELAEYDIYEFIKYMNARLTDRELRCLECKYRYGMTLEETGQKFSVTRERIRQILARAERKLRTRLYKCRRISAEEYDKLLNDHATMCQVYDKVMLLLEKISGESPMSILEALDQHPILSKEINPDPIDNLELSVRSYNCLKRAGFTNVKDIIDTDNNSENSEWIFKVRNLGRKSAEEIKTRLVEKYNYTLKAWRKSDI